MLNVTKEQQGDVLTVRLVGSIEESADFEALIGPPAKTLVVNTKEVPRINSVGVKAWIKYFQAAQAAGSTIRFVECSTAIVEQVNLISNFVCGGTVESIYVPYACGNCGAELVGLYSIDDLKKLQMEVPNLKCTKCGSEAEFDDIPDEYFGFIDR